MRGDDGQCVDDISRWIRAKTVPKHSDGCSKVELWDISEHYFMLFNSLSRHIIRKRRNLQAPNVLTYKAFIRRCLCERKTGHTCYADKICPFLRCFDVHAIHLLCSHMWRGKGGQSSVMYQTLFMVKIWVVTIRMEVQGTASAGYSCPETLHTFQYSSVRQIPVIWSVCHLHFVVLNSWLLVMMLWSTVLLNVRLSL